MKTHTKPTLYNGFKIDCNKSVKHFIERTLFTEVYILTNEEYLYLFTNIETNKVINKRHRHTYLTIRNKNRYIPATITNVHSTSNISSIISELTDVRGFDCVAGMDRLKTVLTNDVINPQLYPERYKKFKLSIPSGILLFGPPGCGKTFIVRKLSEELNYRFFELMPSSIATPYIHGAVTNISSVFEMAKIHSPSIIFIDEIEGLLPKREDLGSQADVKKEEINEFLLQLNNAGDNKVLVVGATNRPHIIDTAILRSGRMDKRIYVGPPDFKARHQLFELCLNGRPFSSNIDFSKLASMTENYVCSDIQLIVTEAARKAVITNKDEIDEQMLIEAIKNCSVSVSIDDLKYYESFGNIERW